MSDVATASAYGVQTEPATVRIQRLLPGPIERVWAYLTESDLRRRWLASGPMDLKVGGELELIWRNDELNDPPGERPPGFGEEHRMKSHITRIDPPRLLAFVWNAGDVTFELERKRDNVLLTVTHRRLTERTSLLSVSAGWHAHLDILANRMTGQQPEPFWDGWARLKKEYDRRLPA